LKLTSLKKNIGLLGGTFDPPHQGHFSISKHSLIKLGLDEVWWIVSKKNPLKKENSKYELRLAETKKFLYSQKIKVFEVDRGFDSIYTIDLIMYLKKKFPKIFFIWLMGADNLINFHHWQKWQSIFNDIAIVVFRRHGYNTNALKSYSSNIYKKFRIHKKKLMISDLAKLPSWTLINNKEIKISSSQIRKQRELLRS